jgi:hypothetical protein
MHSQRPRSQVPLRLVPNRWRFKQSSCLASRAWLTDLSFLLPSYLINSFDFLDRFDSAFEVL